MTISSIFGICIMILVEGDVKMREKLHLSETERKAAGWPLKIGGIALAAAGVAVGIKTKDWGAFAGLWIAGTSAVGAGEAIDETAIRSSSPSPAYGQGEE
jgi:hypothetical protein